MQLHSGRRTALKMWVMTQGEILGETFLTSLKSVYILYLAKWQWFSKSSNIYSELQEPK